MTQQLHLVFEVNEHKTRRLIHLGLDGDKVKSAAREQAGPDSVQLYAALDVDKLSELMRETKGLVVDAVVMSNKGISTVDAPSI